MCNALPENTRTKYISACSKRLKKGGIYVSIPCTKIPTGFNSPPYALAPSVTDKLLEKEFELLFREERLDGACDRVVLAESIELWAKK